MREASPSRELACVLRAKLEVRSRGQRTFELGCVRAGGCGARLRLRRKRTIRVTAQVRGRLRVAGGWRDDPTISSRRRRGVWSLPVCVCRPRARRETQACDSWASDGPTRGRVNHARLANGIKVERDACPASRARCSDEIVLERAKITDWTGNPGSRGSGGATARDYCVCVGCSRYSTAYLCRSAVVAVDEFGRCEVSWVVCEPEIDGARSGGCCV